MTRMIGVACVFGVMGCCHPAPVVVPPSVQRVTPVVPVPQPNFTSGQIQAKVRALMEVALDADQNAGQDKGTTSAIMTWSISADAVLTTHLSGWRSRLAKSWVEAKKDMHTFNPRVVSAIYSIDEALIPEELK